MRVEEITAGRDQCRGRTRNLTSPRGAAKLKTRLKQVSGALRAAFGKTAAMRVHGNTSVDENTLLAILPMRRDEIATFPSRTDSTPVPVKNVAYP